MIMKTLWKTFYQTILKLFDQSLIMKWCCEWFYSNGSTYGDWKYFNQKHKLIIFNLLIDLEA